MNDVKRKNDLYNKYIKKRHTTADTEMLREREIDPQSSGAGSEKYKDHEDAA